MQYNCNLLLLFLLLFYISSVNAAHVINCRQAAAVKRAKRQTAELSTQQQYQQTQRTMHEQLSSQKPSIYHPKVKFFTATPAQQVQSETQQRIVFTTQQLAAAPVLQQQQQHTPSIASQQLTNNQQYYQSNSYLQRQQQQVYNVTNLPWNGQQPQQQKQQQLQTQHPQQFLQAQQQKLQFYKPQTTITATHGNSQYHISNQQPITYQPSTPSQPQQESTQLPNQGNAGITPIFSPLLPSYFDEDDMSFNYTASCDMCCMPDQKPCQNCCDTNPLLSAAVLKSSTG